MLCFFMHTGCLVGTLHHPSSLILIDQLSALRSTASSLGHLSILTRLCAVSQGDGPKNMEGIKTAVSPADP